jgi:S-adenosylmethionine decarboxylase
LFQSNRILATIAIAIETRLRNVRTTSDNGSLRLRCGALNSKELIYEILDELPGLLKMRKIADPQTLPYGGTEGTFDRGGISAFVMIATSHISIHTFVRQRYASVDIFSCKEFDAGHAAEYLSAKFGAKRVDSNLLARGREFPKDVVKSGAIVARDRKKVDAKAIQNRIMGRCRPALPVLRHSHL